MLREARAFRMTPKSWLLKVAFGVPKFTRLNALKNSVRNCRFFFSLNGKFFIRAMSQFFRPGPRNKFRPALPNCNGCGRAKAAVLNQRRRVGSPEFGLPTRSGRCDVARPVDALSKPRTTATGCPPYSPRMLDHSQLPRAKLAGPF